MSEPEEVLCEYCEKPIARDDMAIPIRHGRRHQRCSNWPRTLSIDGMLDDWRNELSLAADLARQEARLKRLLEETSIDQRGAKTREERIQSRLRDRMEDPEYYVQVEEKQQGDATE